MAKYIHRKLEEKVELFLEFFPVVGITGPRQSGKLTMLKNILNKSFKYITFDGEINY